MTFQNLDQIKKEFNLSGDDPKEIRKKLRRLMAKWHPDKHGGENSIRQEIREKYLKANEADQFLEKHTPEQKAIVPVNEVTELVNLVRDLVLVDKKADKLSTSEAQLSERIEQGISQIGKQYLVPRITVSTITTALTFVWLLPGTISEHPVLKNLISITDPKFLTIWVSSLVLTVVVLYGTWSSEERQKHFQSRLNTEMFQNRAFEEYMNQSTNVYTKSGFIRFLTTNYIYKGSSYPFPPITLLRHLIGKPPLIIYPEAAQIIADIVFERAERRGVIKKDTTTINLEEIFIHS